MRLTLLTAASVMALRMGLFLSGRPPEGTDFMLVHFLALITIVFFTGRRMLMNDAHVPFPDLLRDGFRNAALYTLITGLFIWLYFTQVESGYFPERIDLMVAKGIGEGQPEDVIRPRIERFFTPFNYATITFFALLFASGVHALLIGLLHHKVLRRLQ